jgi:hypothetical protein
MASAPVSDAKRGINNGTSMHSQSWVGRFQPLCRGRKWSGGGAFCTKRISKGDFGCGLVGISFDASLEPQLRARLRPSLWALDWGSKLESSVDTTTKTKQNKPRHALTPTRHVAG